jgi:Type VI secretion system/phage-baseplate injector OB domain
MDQSGDRMRYGQATETRHYGKYAGVVADNGPPPSGSHRGEILVNVPGILEETPDGDGNQPIQVTAAPAFLPGYFFVPNVNDTVWVEFVDGDINHPIWSGVWYPRDKTPVTVDGDAPTLDQKIIRTRSGQVIQLDDTSGSQQLVIKDEVHKATITFDGNGITITSPTALTLNFKPDGGTAATLTLDSNGVTATCGQSSLTVSDSQIVLSRPAVSLTVASTVDVS